MFGPAYPIPRRLPFHPSSFLLTRSSVVRLIPEVFLSLCWWNDTPRSGSVFDVVHVAGHSEGAKVSFFFFGVARKLSHVLEAQGLYMTAKVSSVSQIEVLRYPGFERDLQKDVARVPPDGRGIMSRCASTLGQKRSHIP